MTPKILHITIKDKPTTEQVLIFNQWKITNPSFEIRIYTDEDNTNFIKKYYPEYFDFYTKINQKICKIDFIRLLYLYKFGGVYVDSDILPLKDITPLLNISELVLVKESDKNNKNFNTEFIISNAVIISKPNNKFIKKVIDHIKSNWILLQSPPKDISDILSLTGPLLLNKVYSEYDNKNEIILLDGKYFNPSTFYELKENIISDDILYSFGVHLFEGSWWQNEYKPNLNLIQAIIQKHNLEISKINLPLVSCLCITKNKEELITIAIDCFRKQIYPNKELIVIYEDNNPHIESIIKNNSDKNIKYFKIESNPKKTLGELRNISIELSSGEYICQWDDDDWHSPLRIWEQFYYIKKYNKLGSILKNWLVYDERENKLYVRERTDLIGWEGSLLFSKQHIKNLYEHLSRGEDTGFVQKIESQIYPIYYPELYIYRVHYDNTWDYRKLKIDIIEPAQIYKDQSFIFNIIKNTNVKKQIRKVLCFTPSYNRLKMLRGCVADIKNQTYEHTYHTVNITTDKPLNDNLVMKIFEDIKSNKCFISISENQNQHLNHMKAILSVENLDEYDIFIKIDDDDIYKKDYVKNIVNFFENNEVDVLSSKVYYQLNSGNVYLGNQDNLGGNPEGCNFKIPATFAFNKKALNIILDIKTYYGYEDNMWRDAWCGKCIIREIDNTEQFIWHIHDKNLSTSQFHGIW